MKAVNVYIREVNEKKSSDDPWNYWYYSTYMQEIDFSPSHHYQPQR